MIDQKCNKKLDPEISLKKTKQNKAIDQISKICFRLHKSTLEKITLVKAGFSLFFLQS